MFRRRKNRRKEVTEFVLSGPTQVEHVGHLGFASDKGFTAKNLPPSLQRVFNDLNKLLEQYGMRGLSKKEAKFLLKKALELMPSSTIATNSDEPVHKDETSLLKEMSPEEIQAYKQQQIAKYEEEQRNLKNAASSSEQAAEQPVPSPRGKGRRATRARKWRTESSDIQELHSMLGESKDGSSNNNNDDNDNNSSSNSNETTKDDDKNKKIKDKTGVQPQKANPPKRKQVNLLTLDNFETIDEEHQTLKLEKEALIGMVRKLTFSLDVMKTNLEQIKVSEERYKNENAELRKRHADFQKRLEQAELDGASEDVERKLQEIQKKHKEEKEAAEAEKERAGAEQAQLQHEVAQLHAELLQQKEVEQRLRGKISSLQTSVKRKTDHVNATLMNRLSTVVDLYEAEIDELHSHMEAHQVPAPPPPPVPSAPPKTSHAKLGDLPNYKKESAKDILSAIRAGTTLKKVESIPASPDLPDDGSLLGALAKALFSRRADMNQDDFSDSDDENDSDDDLLQWD